MTQLPPKRPMSLFLFTTELPHRRVVHAVIVYAGHARTTSSGKPQSSELAVGPASGQAAVLERSPVSNRAVSTS